jgi:hypothetical protein
MGEWIKKKTGGQSSSRLVLSTLDDLERRTRVTDNLVVYYGPLSIKKFKTFQDLCRDFI